jgi:hypothetical protein
VISLNDKQKIEDYRQKLMNLSREFGVSIYSSVSIRYSSIPRDGRYSTDRKVPTLLLYFCCHPHQNGMLFLPMNTIDALGSCHTTIVLLTMLEGDNITALLARMMILPPVMVGYFFIA